MIVTNYPSPLGPDILSFCWSAEVTRGPRDDAGLHAKQGGGKATKEKNGEKGNQNKGKQRRKRKMSRS
jgi:hypothetical protein